MYTLYIYTHTCLLYIYMYNSVCLYVCLHGCMHVCNHACMHVCVFIYIYIYMCVYVCMYACMHVCMSCHVVSCHVVSCHVTVCHVYHAHIISICYRSLRWIVSFECTLPYLVSSNGWTFEFPRRDHTVGRVWGSGTFALGPTRHLW